MRTDIKKTIRTIHKSSEELAELSKTLALFNEDGTGFNEATNIDDLDDINIEAVIDIIPRVLNSSREEGKIVRNIENLAPIIEDDVDYI